MHKTQKLAMPTVIKPFMELGFFAILGIFLGEFVYGYDRMIGDRPIGPGGDISEFLINL